MESSGTVAVWYGMVFAHSMPSMRMDTRGDAGCLAASAAATQTTVQSTPVQQSH